MKVPVTARLSRKFYDKFGDDIVGELVGLLNDVNSSAVQELRQLNEVNYSRFDARLEQRLAEFRLEFRSSLETTKDSLLRWMIGLWLAQTLTFFGMWMAR